MGTAAAVTKGALLGAANVLAVGWGLGALVAQGWPGQAEDAARVLITIGIVPGLIAGAILGRLACRLTAHRAAWLVSGALAPVCLLGVLAPALIPFAAVPTSVLALALELWTRSDAATSLPSAPPPIAFTGAQKGAVLGVYAAACAAAVLGTMVAFLPDTEAFRVHHEPGPAIGVAVLLLGAVPAILIGALLGRAATRHARARASRRIAGLIGGALLAVAALGALVHQPRWILPAALPVACVALVLERWTRQPPEPLPFAIATAVPVR